MATTIKEEVIITLMDGTEIKARPLKISLLRDFMKKFEEIQKWYLGWKSLFNGNYLKYKEFLFLSYSLLYEHYLLKI
jgi:hypothetical protein